MLFPKSNELTNLASDHSPCVRCVAPNLRENCRKKDLINESGENLGPSTIEKAVEASSSLISQVSRWQRRQATRRCRGGAVKRFVIVPVAWDPAGDELTPMMKLRRKPIAGKYADTIVDRYPNPPGAGVIDLG